MRARASFRPGNRHLVDCSGARSRRSFGALEREPPIFFAMITTMRDFQSLDRERRPEVSDSALSLECQVQSLGRVARQAEQFKTHYEMVRDSFRARLDFPKHADIHFSEGRHGGESFRRKMMQCRPEPPVRPEARAAAKPNGAAACPAPSGAGVVRERTSVGGMSSNERSLRITRGEMNVPGGLEFRAMIFA